MQSHPAQNPKNSHEQNHGQKQLRVLELGPGKGTTTTELLPLFPAASTTYTFTDTDNSVLTQAKQRFREFPFLDYRLLDIQENPQTQGYETHGYDVIIAANALHTTRDLEATLRHVRSLLAPQGILILWEITQPQLDFDITGRLLLNTIEDNRGTNPFLSSDQWQQTLSNHGFVVATSAPRLEALGQHIIFAQADSTVINPANSPENNVAHSSIAASVAKTAAQPANAVDDNLIEQRRRVRG